MSAVVEAVSDVVSSVVDFAGDVVETVVETAADVVQTVADTAVKVVEGAIDDPLGTIAKIGTAIYAPYLLPAVNAAVVVANGGDLDDALTAAAVSYVAPQVGNYVAGEIAGTAFGDMLTDAAAATGIESLPGAVASGIGRAATSTVANVARGQDFEDALESGAISGVASIAGRIAGSEADTGYNYADKLIGTAVNAATNASLRGRDVDDAVENAIAMDLFNTGIGVANKEIKTAIKDWQSESKTGIAALDQPETIELEPTVQASATEETGYQPVMLASASTDRGTISDVEEAPPGFYVDFDGSIKPIQRFDIEGVSPISGEAKEYSDEMFNALVDAFSTKGEQTKVDALGNVYDAQGNFIGYASDFGMTMTSDPTTGGIAWQTESGEVLRVTPFGSDIATPGPSGGTATTDIEGLMAQGEPIGDQEGDYPMQIINNPDGSVTSVEADGSTYTFNVDGSISFTDALGNTSIVGGPTTETTETTTGTDTTTGVSTGAATGQDFNLSNLVSSLLVGTGVTTPTADIKQPGIEISAPTDWTKYIPGFIGTAAAVGSLDDSGTYDPYGFDPYGFAWNPYAVNAPVNAVAYGQEFFEPTYTPIGAAAGGLMSLQPSQPMQYIQPTIPSGMTSNPMTLTADPTASVQMYRHGGHLGSYSDGGRMLKGPGDGMSDDIPATIAGRQPARLANEEFVVPADVVSHLGNGSSEAGARVLYKMMADVRKARTGKQKQAKQINPQRFMPRRG